jgi:hypothetical protein
MRQAQIDEEKAVWELFRELNPDSALDGYVKSERPDFVKGRNGFELVQFIQNLSEDRHGGDHMWEKLYRGFSNKCELMWKAEYPARTLPEAVYYIPHINIREFKGAEAFRIQQLDKCAREFVSFVATVNQKTEIHDDAVMRVGVTLGKYFQGIYVCPSHGPLSDEVARSHDRWGCWGYPRAAGGTSVGCRVSDIANCKDDSVAKYAGSFERLDLLLYAAGETTASSLAPWAAEELGSEEVSTRFFSSIWLLDLPGRRLFPVKTRQA